MVEKESFINASSGTENEMFFFRREIDLNSSELIEALLEFIQSKLGYVPIVDSTFSDLTKNDATELRSFWKSLTFLDSNGRQKEFVFIRNPLAPSGGIVEFLWQIIDQRKSLIFKETLVQKMRSPYFYPSLQRMQSLARLNARSDWYLESVKPKEAQMLLVLSFSDGTQKFSFSIGLFDLLRAAFGRDGKVLVKRFFLYPGKDLRKDEQRVPLAGIMRFDGRESALYFEDKQRGVECLDKYF